MPVAAGGDTAAKVTWTPPTATDNVTTAYQLTLLQTNTPGDLFPFGTTGVAYIFQDAAGNNARCNFNVIVTRECLFVHCDHECTVVHLCTV